MVPSSPSQNYPSFTFVGGPEAILASHRARFSAVSNNFAVTRPRGYLLSVSPGCLATKVLCSGQPCAAGVEHVLNPGSPISANVTVILFLGCTRAFPSKPGAIASLWDPDPPD